MAANNVRLRGRNVKKRGRLRSHEVSDHVEVSLMCVPNGNVHKDATMCACVLDKNQARGPERLID